MAQNYQSEAQIRFKKLKALQKAGVNPYPSFSGKRNCLAEIVAAKDGTELKTAGRLMTSREMGKIVFCHLQDFSGLAQIAFKVDEIGQNKFDFFLKYFDMGDFIGVQGKVFTTKKGEKTLLVKKYELLAKALLPLPEKWHGLQDKEIRYRQRYLDLIMNPEVKKVFLTRQKIVDTIREFMKSNGFIEVETPILQPIYGGASARPFESKLNALNMKVYMRISNELYLKRLIVGGYEKIYEFSKDFRNEGIDKLHNPEFAQVETMWAYADYEDNMKFCEEMISFIVKKIHGTTKIKYQDKEINFKTPWKRINFLDVIKKITKVDFSKAKNLKEAKRLAEKVGVDGSKCDSIGEIMIKVFEELVQEKLIQPTMVYDYPLEAADLAKTGEKQEDKNFVKSFEPIINGWELGLSYCEQNDPEVLKRYWKYAEEKYKKGDLKAQPMDKDFINALEIGMPPTSGLGVGIDRLTMLLTDSPSIRDVILFPFMKPKSQKTQKAQKHLNT